MDTILALQQKRLLRVDEAARILNVSRWTIYRWVEAGRLGGTRIGVGSLRIFSETVAALIQAHSVGGPIPTDVPGPAASARSATDKTVQQPMTRSRGSLRPTAVV